MLENVGEVNIKKEEIETPFITSECLVVVPQSLDKTYLLKHQGEMKIWFTSDSLLIPIKIQKKMKHGTMELILRDYVIKKYNLNKAKLPAISLSDPAVKSISVQSGDVVKITRISPTSGEMYYYRMVIGD